MFINDRRQASEERDFMSMLLHMTSCESMEIPSLATKKIAITTSELANEIRHALTDVFNANITIEENHVIRLDFPSSEVFKLRLIKE